jgi:hypothetical protein
MLQRPATTLGRLWTYDGATGLATVKCRHPAGTGMLILPNLAVPQAARGLFGSAPAVGSEVSLICASGNPEFAQVVAIKPPGQTNIVEHAVQDRPRTYTPPIAAAGLKGS